MTLSRRTLLSLSVIAPAAFASAVEIDPTKALGKNSAPITYELFSDFQCPACQRFHTEAIRPMIEDYVRPGKVYLVWRDFPLVIHPFARTAASLCTAAAHLGKFERVSNLLFDKQTQWTGSGDLDPILLQALSPAELKKVREMAKTPAILQLVERDIDAGRKQGVTQTPTSVITFRIRPYPIAGGVSYSMLRRFLDDLLSK
jgi:protein-disulfide isomerase